MKFKRLSSNKLQVIVTQNDLLTRNIKKWDLLPYNPQTQELFQEILRQAAESCGFEIKREAQLIVEAYPVSSESMIIIITKISDDKENQNHFLNLELESMIDSHYQEKDISLSTIENNNVSIFEFEELEDIIETAHVICGHYRANSSVFKSYNGKYFLLLEDLSSLDQNVLGFILEYSYRTKYSRAFLNEHTEAIIVEGAIEKLALV